MLKPTVQPSVTEAHSCRGFSVFRCFLLILWIIVWWVREGSQNMHWPRHSLERFPGYKWIENTRIFWNIQGPVECFGIFQEDSLELQLNDDFTHVLAHCSPILATEIHLTAVSPILSQRIFFPCKIINLIPPPPEKQWSKRTPCQCKILPFMSGCYWYRPLQETV